MSKADPCMTIKLRVDSANEEHIRVTLFSRRFGGDTFANCGQLCMDTGEYQLFAAALSLGSAVMPLHLKVLHDDRVFREAFKLPQKQEDAPDA